VTLNFFLPKISTSCGQQSPLLNSLPLVLDSLELQSLELEQQVCVKLEQLVDELHVDVELQVEVDGQDEVVD
jgi:hypothetical protein